MHIPPPLSKKMGQQGGGGGISTQANSKLLTVKYKFIPILQSPRFTKSPLVKYTSIIELITVVIVKKHC